MIPSPNDYPIPDTIPSPYGRTLPYDDTPGPRYLPEGRLPPLPTPGSARHRRSLDWISMVAMLMGQ